MSRRGYLLLALAASTPVAGLQLRADTSPTPSAAFAQDDSTPVAIPTVVVPSGTTATVPPVSIPQSTPPVVPTLTIPKKPSTSKKAAHRAPTHKRVPVKVKVPSGTWITAYLTSYCPGSAGAISSSGMPVFYGMLANDYYPFGTRVYIPVLGITGVVEDRIGSLGAWNHFDVWSPTCYGTPTGYFPVAVRPR